MGSLLSRRSNSRDDDYKGIYRVKAKDIAAMKKVWLVVENDLSYYSSIFSTILFRNHPRYVKYFHEDNIPEFVHDARIKKKFSAVCAIVGALFIDYSNKRQRRDHLLGYIAMIHKDMQLTSEDLENFMMDLLEMLIQERPREMTAECTLVHMRYFGGLLDRIVNLMEVQRERDLYRLEDEPSKSRCGWTSLCYTPSIYGRSLDYWIAKKHYWQVRMAVWSSLDKELSGMSSFLTTKKITDESHNFEAIKHRFGNRPSRSLAKDRRNPWSKATRHLRSSVNTSSESGYNDVDDNNLHRRTIVWYERCKRINRRYRRNSSSLNSRECMEAIPEVRSRQAIAPSRKSFTKNTRTLGNRKVHVESPKISSEIPIKRETMIDTARARKRRRDRKVRRAARKKGNGVHPTGASNDDGEDAEHT